jgi:hypothetical protein
MLQNCFNRASVLPAGNGLKLGEQMANKQQLTEALMEKVTKIVDENVAEAHHINEGELGAIDEALGAGIAYDAAEEIDGIADDEDDSEVEDDEDEDDDEDSEEASPAV